MEGSGTDLSTAPTNYPISSEDSVTIGSWQTPESRIAGSPFAEAWRAANSLSGLTKEMLTFQQINALAVPESSCWRPSQLSETIGTYRMAQEGPARMLTLAIEA